ncbi:MAG: hypothetical protein COX82_03780 [Candidatus Magasanikbacteria bacterium CG_4_10_14_0_2_um_filter_41_10]|uniref:Nudix hydrolase domain-containing protein n=1 Tax=Candidatus Magasanikbacteria bacterium CG_4_10_14_0_2_um_filter_41_10 TaxID=1974638 RepID=A0A2M7V343_9BACT|nr:MAG: hypothetical protein COX82_03780 [Candidatus Magasanikbacteria bacterium CG_4_10_14_0_2_um_filter_41_10]
MGSNTKIYREDPAHQFPSPLLDAVVYALASAAMIVVTVDVMIINRARRSVFLSKLSAPPQKGWYWYMGGRRFPGEDARSAMHRKFHQETGLDVDPHRFEFVTIAEHTFVDREEEPQDVGRHSMAHTYVIELTADEIETVRRGLDPTEFVEGFLEEIPIDDVDDEIDPLGIIRDIIDIAFRETWWKKTMRVIHTFLLRSLGTTKEP